MSTESYRYIGKATPRKDGVDIVTGSAKYIDDIKIPGMLYGKVLRSPHAHANIKHIDTTRARRLKGLKTVLTFDNTPDWFIGVPEPHQRVLDSRLRYVGDAVALVAAVTTEIAEEALEQIDVEYEVLPAVNDVDEALKPGAPQLYDAYSNNIFPAGCPRFFGPDCLTGIVLGDVAKGFQEADFTAEGTYGYENLPNPLPPEPPGVIARWEGPAQITLWASIQCSNLLRMALTRIMKVPVIRVIGLHCGGSYGSKNEPWLPALYTAALAGETNKPVKLCYSKEEHFSTYVLRLGSRIHAKIGMKKDGTVTAIEGEWLVDTGAFSGFTQGQIAVGCGETQMMINSCRNWQLNTKIVATNRNPSGVVRGFGGQELKSALLPLWSLVMEKANLDPVEVFKKNYVKPGDGYYWRDGKWYTCTGKDYSKAIDKGAQVFGWNDKWKGWLQPSTTEGPKRTGVGVGVHGNADSGEDETEAYVRLNADGTVVLHCLVNESGMGERSSVCKMVAEVLNMPLDRVIITEPDTMINPFNFDLVGSRGTYTVGYAVIEAAENARQELLELAAQKLEAPKEILETEDGLVYLKERPTERIPWIKVMGPMRTITGYGRFEADYTKPNFMATFVEVEVDTDTGKTNLKRVVQATDAGQIIDPPSLEGQLYGGIGSAGIDTALFEETIFDKASGRILNANLIDYKWRTFSELPVFENAILETGMATHRFKALGVGEISTSPGPGATLMAISNALGRRIKEYPATPERILKALGKA
ncbi:MAG: xanthine dehydrogenase family protein molybdopterin-binding subunit [Pseudomonadota bacterium]